LESLRDFRPPTADQKTEMVSFFDGKGKLPEKLHIIGGAGGIKGQKVHEDSLDELRFFEKPVEEFVEKNEMGFKKVNNQRVPEAEREEEDSEGPMAKYLQQPKKGKGEDKMFRQTPNDSSEASSANNSHARN
jgi:hypothetical protein